jgi:lysophospholipase L1-like esterase
MCKDSIYVRRCVGRVMDAHPDIIVIYSGHNDFGGFTSRFPRALMFIQWHPWLVDLERALARTRGYSLLARPIVLWHTEPSLLKALPDWDLRRVHDIILDEYTANISAVITRARQQKTPVILVTVVSNLLEFPFRADRWDRLFEHVRTAQEPLEPWLSHLVKGIKLFRAGHFEAALTHLKRSRDNHYPTSRAVSALNERLREFSAANEHVHLVDFERELDRLGMEEGIGCGFFGTEVYCDHVHPNPRTNKLIADAIFRTLSELRSSTPQ